MQFQFYLNIIGKGEAFLGLLSRILPYLESSLVQAKVLKSALCNSFVTQLLLIYYLSMLVIKAMPIRLYFNYLCWLLCTSKSTKACAPSYF